MNYRPLSAAAVGQIVEAVAADAPISAKPDRSQLGRDLGRALFWRRTFNDVSPAQAWARRQKHGEELIRAARAFADAWTKDTDAGQWWRQQLATYPDLAKAVVDFEALIADLMADRLTSSKEPEEGRSHGQWPVCWLLEPDRPQSSLEWLVGGHLATIFEHHFAMPAKVSQSRSRRKDGTVVYGEPRGAYIAFVLAVLKAGKIRNPDGSPITPATVFRYRKRVMRKVQKIN